MLLIYIYTDVGQLNSVLGPCGCKYLRSNELGFCWIFANSRIYFENPKNSSDALRLLCRVPDSTFCTLFLIYVTNEIK